MSRDIKRDIMLLVTCLPPEDILALTIYIGVFQDAIARKDALLRESLKMLQGASYEHPYPNAAGGINELIKKIEQEIGDE